MEDLIQSITPERAASDGGRTSAPSSPEFEFWVVRNPSVPPTHLLSADDLFINGVMLPLQLLHPHYHDPLDDAPPPPPPQPGEPIPPELDQLASPAAYATEDPSTEAISSAPVTASRRWKDIFRGASAWGEKAEARRPSRERKISVGGAAELNINIWPFSRSRSAGNGSTSEGAAWQKHFATAGGRKVSSVPCSRSNSRGESSSSSRPAASYGRRSASSPGRAGGRGIHVGRGSLVWQVRKGGKKVADGKGGAGGGGREGSSAGAGVGVRVVTLNVNTCKGYGNHVSCRGEYGSTVTSGDRSGSVGGGGGGGHGIGSHFNLRALFSKKVH